VRQEVETGPGQSRPAFALEPLVELLLHLVEVADVRGGIILLSVRQIGGAPVRGLLLLGDVDLEQLLDQLLEAVAVGIGADQPRRGLGAIDGTGHDSEIGLHDRQVEAGEMIELEAPGIGEDRLEVGSVIAAAGAEADEMLVAAAVGDLDEAEPVAAGQKAHRLGVDGDRAGGEHPFGQVLFVEMDGHGLSHRRKRLNAQLALERTASC
jgi:hypothetical protein